MKKYKSIKYRIYPNKEQQSLIFKTFGCSRFVYNYMLEESIKRKLELSERKYICTCGLEIDRDLNAAINIKNEGLRLLA